MSNQNKSMDKVNMSLDDIIKLNRNQSRQNKFSANRNINVNNKPQQQQQKNGQRRNFNNGNNQNRRPNQQRRQQQQQQKAPVNNKPYGMLNRSKTIQKRNTFQQNKQKVVILQTNRNQQQSASRGIPRNLNNRRRLANAGAPRLFNRFGSKAATIGTKFQGQKQNFARNNQQPRQPQRNRAQPFRQQQQPVKNVKIQMQQKRIQQLRQPRAANNVRQKIAMQSARKNVMKAKSVLANKVTAKKGPIQQIMTQRYAKSLGLIKPVGVRRPMAKRSLPRQSNKLSTLNVNNRINKTNRVKQQQRKNLTKNVQQQFKRPALNRNRQQQRQSIPGRKVFF